MTSLKTTSELQRQREKRLDDLRFQLNMTIRAPYRFEDEEMRNGAVDFLKSSIAELERQDKPLENEKPLRPGKGRLRARLRNLVALILTQTTSVVKGP